MTSRWRYGDVIVRREVLGLAPVRQVGERAPSWYRKPWMAVPVHVVEDNADALVTYIAPGAQFGFYAGDWPSADHQHPWVGRTSWTGHGTLMVQRPGDHHAVWHFWTGERREFSCWYINFQTDFVRTALGYDTQDLELDLVVLPGGEWFLKDHDVLPDRVSEGRFSASFVVWIESLGAELTTQLDAGRRWWDPKWVDWTPDAEWRDTKLPPGWADD